MRSRACTGPRTALLAVASAAGLLLARLVDALGALPGVTEQPAVRQAALDGRASAVGVLGCLVLGAVAARALARSPALAVLLLVLGQLGLVWAVEEGTRALVPGLPAGHDAGLWPAVAVQLVLATLAVATALVVLSLVPPVLLLVPERARPGMAALPPYRLVVVRQVPGGLRGRGPPRLSPCASPRPTDTPRRAA